MTILLCIDNPIVIATAHGVALVNHIANCDRVRAQIAPPGAPLDFREIVSAPENLTMILTSDDAALFMRTARPDQWEGHFLFGRLRGRAAKAAAQRACRLLFDVFPALAITGEVPVANRAARVMARAIGCTPVGTSVDRLGRSCILYSMER